MMVLDELPDDGVSTTKHVGAFLTRQNNKVVTLMRLLVFYEEKYVY
jgi:hypothetical protein